ncbi:hypothetical protein [Chryseobacterium defluvii]|nr:hypothetical protein [Chryseobacterium defluvii]
MKMKIAFTFFLQACLFNAQISEKVQNFAKPLDTISHAESSRIGIAGEKSKIYEYFKKLSEVANNDDLFYFAKNGSNSLKLYSSQELFKRNDKRFLEIYKFYAENPLIMNYKMGCIGSRQNIADFLRDEIYSAKEIIGMRDILLKEKDDVSKAQLESIIQEGYHQLTLKEVEFYRKEIEKIDSKIK